MKKIHLICNAHIDPIWQWDWQEGVSATLSTFRTAAALAEKYDYVFCHNEVTVYKYVEEYAPELFEKIRTLVKAGKWRIMGGWYLQPDCNMPSGESFVRQIRMGFAYFREKFGVVPETAFNPDAFGHTRGLVQILKKCGQNSLILCRPYPYELTLKNNSFLWQGFDGSEIKVFRSPEGYNTPLGKAADEIKARIENRPDGVGCVLWGVGNHGGGPSDKDLADLEKLMQESDSLILHSYPEAYFAEAEPTERVSESLRISMPGCYTSMIEVKQKHIRLENELYLAEIMCTLAAAKGLMTYPEEALSHCFEDLLNGEFHDVLPGSCVKSGEENGVQLFDHGYLDATRLKTKAFFALASNQSVAAEGEFPVLVFNPHPYALKDNVECEFMLADQNWDTQKVANVTVKDGEIPVRMQTVKEDSTINLDWRKRIIFEAELPPMSMKRYSVYLTFAQKPERKEQPSLIYDDGRKYVEIDGNTGLLKSYRIQGREYVKNGCAPVMFHDNPDPWGMSPQQRVRLGTDGEPFTLMQEPHGVFAGMKSVQVIEDGDVYLGVEAFFEKENSKARVEYRIYKNSDDVDVNVNLFLQDADRIVKLEIPVVDGTRVVGQTAYGTEELFSDARENISQRFTAVQTQDTYLAVFDRSRYGGHYENGKLYLSLARGATYCAHPIADRQLIPSDRYTHKIDQGEHDYHFRLSVCREEELDRKATEFNRKPYAVNIFPVGDKRQEANFPFTFSNPNVTLTAFKKSSEEDGYVLRLHNNTSKPQKTCVTVGGAKADLTFGAYEIKTLLYNDTLQETAQLIL